MKSFVFKVTKTGKSKYGGTYQYADIYIIKRGKLEHIGKTRKWCTSSYRGSYSEVNEWLLENKIIPKSWSKGYEWQEQHKSRGIMYSPYYNLNEKYEIKEI